jgi:hypothetical protein
MSLMRIIDDNRPMREADGVVGQYSFWLGDEGVFDPDLDDDAEGTSEGAGSMRGDGGSCGSSDQAS